MGLSKSTIYHSLIVILWLNVHALHNEFLSFLALKNNKHIKLISKILIYRCFYAYQLLALYLYPMPFHPYLFPAFCLWEHRLVVGTPRIDTALAEFEPIQTWSPPHNQISAEAGHFSSRL